MIIVSQNRRRTINFDRVAEIFMEFNDKEHKYFIKCEKTNGKNTVLGKYKSEKQTEQILMSFNQAYILQGQAVQTGNGMTQFQAPMFYMPEEIKEEN